MLPLTQHGLSRRDFAECLLVFCVSLGLTCFLYRNAATAWFVLDDYVWLEGASARDFLGFFFGSWGHEVAYRPLMRLSFGLDSFLFGENPLGWHLHSFALHAANALWLYLIVRHFVRDAATSPLPRIAAALFVVGPSGHENIAWISARTHLTGGFFYLGALFFLLEYLKGSRRRIWLTASLLMFLFGMMAYESVFSLPILLAVCAIPVLSRSGLPRADLFRIIGLYWILGGVVFLIRFMLLGGQLGTVGSTHTSYLPGLLQSLRDVAFLILKHFDPLMLRFWFLLAGAAWVVATKRWLPLRSLLLAAICGIVLYLPFSASSGVGFRYLYLVQIAVIIGVLIVFDALRQKGIWGEALVLLLFSSIFVSDCLTSRGLANEWETAGRIARAIPEQARTLCPEPPPGLNFVFHGVPDTYGHAGVCLTYFDTMVKRRYKQFDGEVYRDQDLLRDDWYTDFPSNRRDIPAKYFRWMPDEEQLIDISQTEWEALIGIPHAVDEDAQESVEGERK
jgi:hypothetical protein